MNRKERYAYVLKWFKKNMPDAQTELVYHTPYELLVAVILSAQCTDKRVNMTTPAFFKNFPNVYALSQSTPEEIFTFIKSISYPNNKARHLSGMAKKISEEFGGDVPGTVKELMSLPGVGRKTANVILSVAHNKPAMAVDTHVFRVAHRIGLVPSTANTPDKVEKVLVSYIDEEDMAKAHHWLILHGRYVCLARKPLCTQCGIRSACLYGMKNKENV